MTVQEQSIVGAARGVDVDAFAKGFAAGCPADPWFHVAVNTYLTADGCAATLPSGGLKVTSPAVHAETGHPRFSNSLAPESRNGGIPATNDHAKWLAYINQQSAAGFPGFDAPAGTELVGTARITGRTFGAGFHPFGAAVEDPEADPRLAAAAMTTIDIESWMVFDFLFTNRRIYALYERLPFGRRGDHAYASFSYAIPVAERRPRDWHEATIAYDQAAHTVRWTLDGSEVFRVSRLGHHLPRRDHLLIDLGGDEQPICPRQLAFGMGLFTLLDGALGSGPGLVRLSDREQYRTPRGGKGQALTFVDEHSRPESRLFGQGAELSVSSYVVRRVEGRTI